VEVEEKPQGPQEGEEGGEGGEGQEEADEKEFPPVTGHSPEGDGGRGQTPFLQKGPEAAEGLGLLGRGASPVG